MTKRKRARKRWWNKAPAQTEPSDAQQAPPSDTTRGLDELPNELLVVVVTHLCLSAPESFLAFACTSQRACTLASVALRAAWPQTWTQQHDAEPCFDAHRGQTTLVRAALDASSSAPVASVALLSRRTAAQLALVLFKCERIVCNLSIAHDVNGELLSMWALDAMKIAAFDLSVLVLRTFCPMPHTHGDVFTSGRTLESELFRDMALCMRSALGAVVLVFTEKSVRFVAPTRSGLTHRLFSFDEEERQEHPVLCEPKTLIAISARDWMHALSLLRKGSKITTLVHDSRGLAIVTDVDDSIPFRYDLSRVPNYQKNSVARYIVSYLWRISLVFQGVSTLYIGVRGGAWFARSDLVAGVGVAAALCDVQRE